MGKVNIAEYVVLCTSSHLSNFLLLIVWKLCWGCEPVGRAGSFGLLHPGKKWICNPFPTTISATTFAQFSLHCFCVTKILFEHFIVLFWKGSLALLLNATKIRQYFLHFCTVMNILFFQSDFLHYFCKRNDFLHYLFYRKKLTYIKICIWNSYKKK